MILSIITSHHNHQLCDKSHNWRLFGQIFPAKIFWFSSQSALFRIECWAGRDSYNTKGPSQTKSKVWHSVTEKLGPTWEVLSWFNSYIHKLPCGTISWPVHSHLLKKNGLIKWRLGRAKWWYLTKIIMPNAAKCSKWTTCEVQPKASNENRWVKWGPGGPCQPSVYSGKARK